ncbi:MAG: glycosyltransferase family 2 protein [Kordiimonas sp.]
MNSKLRKLYENPVAYCLDSKLGFLRSIGDHYYNKQTKRYAAIGAANSERKVTVIMTAYNTGDLVADAVRSVLAQSHSNLDLMIIDDASSDDTLSILKEMASSDERIKLFHSPVNHGTYWSKNWCLANAAGEFVAFHDSDDISAPQRLQMQLGAMLDGAGADAVTCRWNRVTPNGDEITIDGSTSRTAIISTMIRREKVVKEAGFFDTVRIAADTEYHMRIAKILGRRRTRNLRHVLYTGLLRDQSLTRGPEGGFNWKEDGNAITRSLSGNRAEYGAAFKKWHAEAQSLYVGFPQSKRPFEVPLSLLEACDDIDMAQVEHISSGGVH